MFKICIVCTPRYQRPIALAKRKCPVCGARSKYAFRKATPEELAAQQEQLEKRQRLLQELINEPD